MPRYTYTNTVEKQNQTKTKKWKSLYNHVPFTLSIKQKAKTGLEFLFLWWLWRNDDTRWKIFQAKLFFFMFYRSSFLCNCTFLLLRTTHEMYICLDYTLHVMFPSLFIFSQNLGFSSQINTRPNLWIETDRCFNLIFIWNGNEINWSYSKLSSSVCVC